MSAATKKKKHEEAPPVEPATEHKQQTEYPDQPNGGSSTPPAHNPPPPAPRHKRTKVEMAAVREAERIAKMSPLEAITEQRRVLEEAIRTAELNMELSEAALIEARGALEKFKEEKRPEAEKILDELRWLKEI